MVWAVRRTCCRDLIFAIKDNADDHNKYEYVWKSQLKSAEKNLLRKNLKLKKKCDYIASLYKSAAEATTTIENIKNEWASRNVNAKLLLLPLPASVFVFILLLSLVVVQHAHYT